MWEWIGTLFESATDFLTAGYYGAGRAIYRSISTLAHSIAGGAEELAKATEEAGFRFGGRAYQIDESWNQQVGQQVLQRETGQDVNPMLNVNMVETDLKQGARYKVTWKYTTVNLDTGEFDEQFRSAYYDELPSQAELDYWGKELLDPYKLEGNYEVSNQETYQIDHQRGDSY